MNSWIASWPQSTPVRTSSRSFAPVAENSTTYFKMGAQFIARSILEWIKKSEIVIASRVFEDHQTLRDRIDNTHTIKKYAREARVWPHEEIFGKEQVLRDVKFYVTDGSFTVKTALNQRHHHLRTDTSRCW
jgi:hypothetical protein